MSVHDDVVLYRTQIVALIEASRNKRVACREAGIHHSTFYRWRRDPEPVRNPGSWADQLLERQIVAAALADPSAGPQRLADQLEDRGVQTSASRVWRVLVKHRLNTRTLRYALLSQHLEPPSITVAETPVRKMGISRLMFLVIWYRWIVSILVRSKGQGSVLHACRRARYGSTPLLMSRRPMRGQQLR